MAYNYVVTALKSTSVGICATANFTAPDELNLIVAKGTRLEIFTVNETGLEPLCDVGLYGRIATMKVFRSPVDKKDNIFITTERHNFAVLEYNATTGEISTKAQGSVKDKIGRPTDRGQIAIVHQNMILTHIYDGVFKVLPIDNKGVFQDMFNVRLDHLNVLDIVFLTTTSEVPTVAVLYEDSRGARHIQTYEVLLKEQSLSEGPWQKPNVETGADRLIPVRAPFGGVLVIGQQTIAYHSSTMSEVINIGLVNISAWGAIDTTEGEMLRYLLGDGTGTLGMLVLENDGDKITALQLEAMGSVSLSNDLCYLDNGVIFNARYHPDTKFFIQRSVWGDSQLLRLSPEADESGSFVEVLDEYTNLGPITDLVVVDLDQQGQGQVVTCSGCRKDGSLRVVRNGIGIMEQACIELPGIKRMWSLHDTSSSTSSGDTDDTTSSGGARSHKYLVQSFIAETRVLCMDGDELGEVEINGFNAEVSTLYCGNMSGDVLVQVTPASVIAVQVNASTGVISPLCVWSPPIGQSITVATASGSSVLLSHGGGELVYLQLEDNVFVLKCATTMEHDIACVDICRVEDVGEGMEVEGLASSSNSTDSMMWAVVGLWTDQSVRVLRLPSMVEACKQLLGGLIIPRSIMVARFEATPYLLVGLGDGTLFNFLFDETTGTLSEKKKVALGTQPITLTKFTSGDTTHVFAASDRPTVIFGNNGKLLYSNVNLKDVAAVAPFETPSFPGCLAISNEEELLLGCIDSIQKLHIRTIPLGEQPRRLAHYPSTGTFAVCTLLCSFNEFGEEVEAASIKIFDDSSFEQLDSFALHDNESPLSCIVASLGEGTVKQQVICVGTAMVLPDEPEPTQGRILLLSVEGEGSERKLKLLAETETPGAVYCLNDFNGKLLGGINAKVQLYTLSSDDMDSKKLVAGCHHHGHILCLFLRSRGDFIIVGDLVKSINLLHYLPDEDKIEEIARDYNPNWMTAIEMLDGEHFLGAEGSFNLFTLAKNSEATTDEERARLEVVGEFHLGEMVNQFASGSLVMRQPSSSGVVNPDFIDVSLDGGATEGKEVMRVEPTHVFGTVSGSIGVVCSLTKPLFELLEVIEEALTRVVHGVGGFEHSEWRSFENTIKVSKAKHFIDGDLVERFLDLPKPAMKKVLMHVNEALAAKNPTPSSSPLSLADLVKHIEDLVRCH